MKISNETKVGALTAVAIVALILGFNFLKGKNLTSKTMRLYAVFGNIQGLAVSNPVVINGKQVGIVYSTEGGRDMRRIVVAITMNEIVDIPDNSIAFISPSLLTTTSVEIKLGNSNVYKKDGDTLSTKASAGMLDEAFQRVDPVLTQVKTTLKSVDSVLLAINSIFDPGTKHNIRSIMDNLNTTTARLALSSASLQSLLNTQTGALSKTLDNMSAFTGGLKNNNAKIDNTLTNLEATTAKLSRIELEKTLTSLDLAVTDLKNTMGRINSDKGTLGLMLNDTRLYNNLNATSNKLNLLLDDVRMHPKRYVHVSVFGKKDKGDILMVPLPDTVNAPYISLPKQ